MKHIKGDIFESNADVILNLVNCFDDMDVGFPKLIKEKFPVVYEYYEFWRQSPYLKPLGHIQLVYPHKDNFQVIVNMYARNKFGKRYYTEYVALKNCLAEVNNMFAGCTVAIPCYFGYCEADMNWFFVSEMIEDTLTDCDVVIYE